MNKIIFSTLQQTLKKHSQVLNFCPVPCNEKLKSVCIDKVCMSCMRLESEYEGPDYLLCYNIIEVTVTVTVTDNVYNTSCRKAPPFPFYYTDRIL